MKMHLALSICLLFFLQTVVVKANELPEFELYSENSFFYTDEIEGVLFLDGEITNDMYGEFRRALVENNIHTLVLNSPGGNLYEGLQMAGTIFDRQLTTYIPNGADCASACSIMYLAGKKRYSRGQLGVHQSAYSDDVSKQKDVVGKIDYESQITTADIIQHLEEFGTPGFVYVKMLRTPPEDMYFFDEDELDELGNQSITIKEKQEFAKIDQFLNSLYAKLEIISCRENASSCSDETLCKYASKDKAWLKSLEAVDYVREALNRNLSCGVPEAQCPKDLKKCNDAYVCTNATKLDPYLPAWENNKFFHEAVSRNLNCGVSEETTHHCSYETPYSCTKVELCRIAYYEFGWFGGAYYEAAVQFAKDLKLDCRKINSSKSSDISQIIEELQSKLSNANCDVGQIDGVFGKNTARALEEAALILGLNYSGEYIPSRSFLLDVIYSINKKKPSFSCYTSVSPHLCSYQMPKACPIKKLCKLAYNETDWFEGVYYQKAVSAAKELKLNCRKINSNY